MVALEAFASRVPLIATPVGGVRHLVGPVDSRKACAIEVAVGNPAQLRDALLQVRTRVHMVADMTQRAHDMVTREFGVDRAADAFLDMYSELCREHHRASRR